MLLQLVGLQTVPAAEQLLLQEGLSSLLYIDSTLAT